jgi:drug/metabolite transporter (DMT)-like permease
MTDLVQLFGLTFFGLVLALVLFLSPAVITRIFILKKPASRKQAWWFSVVLFIAILIVSFATWSPGESASITAPIFYSVVSFFILRRGHRDWRVSH